MQIRDGPVGFDIDGIVQEVECDEDGPGRVNEEAKSIRTVPLLWQGVLRENVSFLPHSLFGLVSGLIFVDSLIQILYFIDPNVRLNEEEQGD